MLEERLMSYSELSMHASKAAHNYLIGAIESIDGQMGKGAAEKYPAIVAAMIQAASADYLAAMLSHRVSPALEDIAASIDRGNE